MKHANIVIGANFGDEGKGLVTDYLAARAIGMDCLVIRHNGGAQAGHTVTTPDGKRHVFHHFGSGTLAGASTLLSRFFACNPLIYLRELGELQKLGVNPIVYIDADAPITTPYDMMINQIVEESRGQARHGSVGLGYGETIERSLKPVHNLTFRDLSNTVLLRARLRDIQKRWAPKRLKALGVDTLSAEWTDNLASPGVIEGYINEVQKFLASVRLAPPDLLQKTPHIVFEGAQGLLLDQERGWFPHVTRSHTGIKNACILAAEAGIETIDVYYATRAYATRHGAGPLPHELPKQPYAKIRDDTNLPHQFQGTLRFAWLDVDLLTKSIQTDLGDAVLGLRIQHHVAVSCVDQLDNDVTYILNQKPVTRPIEDFLADVLKATKATSLLVSRGPTRVTMAEFQPEYA